MFDYNIIIIVLLLYLVLLLKLEQSEYYIFDSNKSVEICLKVENGGNEQCQADADFYYRVHTYGGNASKIDNILTEALN